MDLRKVQLTGGTSLTVTLPKPWVEKVGLQPGDVVGCQQQQDGTLTVAPHARGERALQKYHIPISEGDEAYLFRKVIAAYLNGYDAVVLKSKTPLSPDTRTAIRNAVQRIIGLEIVEEEPHTITVQDFLDPREFHMDKALRRMDLLTQAMQKEALEALEAPSEEAVRSVEDRDDEVDRLYWLVNKQHHATLRDATYAAKMELSPSQALNFLLVARLVERTADHAARIAEQAVAMPEDHDAKELLARIGERGREATELFREALQAFHATDAKRANAIIERANAFQKDQGALLKDAAALGGETVALTFIIESVWRTAAYAADICEVAMNHQGAAPLDGGA